MSPTVRTVAIDRPPVNVLDIATMQQLAVELREAGEDTCAVVLRGAGRHFCAGADVAEHLPPTAGHMLGALYNLYDTIASVPVPTVAVIRGACLGAGLEIAMACDVVFAAEDAKLGFPEVALGVIAPIATANLPVIVGPVRAADLLYSGRTISGKEAAAMGLATEAVPDGMLDECTGVWLKRLEGHSIAALRACKRALRDGTIAGAFQVYNEAVIHSPDAIEGLNAFLEKRPPQWKHH